jgi:hypothetical protein
MNIIQESNHMQNLWFKTRRKGMSYNVYECNKKLCQLFFDLLIETGSTNDQRVKSTRGWGHFQQML